MVSTRPGWTSPTAAHRPRWRWPRSTPTPTSVPTTRTWPLNAPEIVTRAVSRLAACALATLLCACASTTPVPRLSPAQSPDEAGLVDIRSLVPDMAQEIRYAGRNNFAGMPIDGYDAPRCHLLEPVAEALQKVEQDLREQDLRLKIFDCYRPTRAVAHFVRWANDPDDQRNRADYY